MQACGFLTVRGFFELLSPTTPRGLTEISVTEQSGIAGSGDQSASGGISPPQIRRRIFHLKRTTLIVSALCFALGAFSAFAEDKMGHDAMGKPDAHDKMGKADKKRNKDKMGKMDKMEKPNAMQ
jgi:hypothetical protein